MSGKYHAVKVEADGHKFDSKAEYRRWQELCLLVKADEIYNLEVHPAWDLVVNGVKVAKYIGDFAYINSDGEAVCEDVKSKPTMTPVYRLKKRLMKAIYKIDIVEVAA